ncbi:MAG TPA: GDP-mannose 4,6-dehydratase [Planctomycetota bacterium]|nr:GDP-mannose 4,6-dehydratase [Planctomycetota bacterium]
MKILVTGAAGFIGSHLIPTLLQHGHTVAGLVRFSTTASDSSKRRVARLEALTAQQRDKFQLLRGENLKGLPDLLKKFAPDVCIHLAGRSWVRESVGWPEVYIDANYRFTTGLVQSLHLVGCKRIVFGSTVMVYGKDAPLPYMEDQLGSSPASPYGASKLACEVLLNTFHALHKMEVVNLRLFSVYGPELRQDLVPFLIAAAILRNKPFTVFGDGSSMRDYIEVRDAVAAIEAACVGHETYEALNVGSGFGTSLLELVQLIEKSLGKKAELVYKPAVPGELAVAIPDISLAMENLKWEPKVSIEEGIERMAAWFKSSESPLRG